MWVSRGNNANRSARFGMCGKAVCREQAVRRACGLAGMLGQGRAPQRVGYQRCSGARRVGVRYLCATNALHGWVQSGLA